MTMLSLVFRQLVCAGYIHVYGFLTVLLLLSFAACNGGPQNAQAPKPKTLTAEDLRKLRWIEGSWRGSGTDQAPFFERYRFENDTTLAVDHFDNETLSNVSSTERYELKDGEFRGGSGNVQFTATSIDDNSITFSPSGGARNSFTWKRESKDSWTAILSWPASGDKPAGERTYQMERWPKQ
jgi:hypothetical protein